MIIHPANVILVALLAFIIYVLWSDDDNDKGGYA